jgi:hypothetical protein
MLNLYQNDFYHWTTRDISEEVSIIYEMVQRNFNKENHIKSEKAEN